MERGKKSGEGSRGANSGHSCHEVNDECHRGGVGVLKNDGHVMASPQVYAIYWDDYFQQEQREGEAVDLMNRFFKEILRGRFMRGLEQYGVGRGDFVGHKIIPEPRPPATLSPDDIEKQLKEWIDKKIITRAPESEEKNLLYVIFTPNHTLFDAGYCTCGYHEHGRYGTTSGDDNLFWAAIQEWHHHNRLPYTPRGFVDSCSWCVSHEMVEAFTNRDGRGYQTKDGCEIGDICECAKGSRTQKTPIIKAEVDGWWVEPYWDNRNKSCYPLHIVPRHEAPVKGYETED